MSEKPKVVIVAPGNGLGGQAAQAAFLVRHWLDDPDLQLKLAVSDPGFPQPLRALERLPYVRTMIRLFIYTIRLWRELWQCDVVHIFSASYWSFLLVVIPAWLIARQRQCKIVLHYHSGEAADHLERWSSARWLLGRMDRIAVPSRYLAGIFALHGFSAVVVPNAIDGAQFRYRKRTTVRPNLLCTRAFEPYYRIDLVVRAFAAVKQAIPEATLTLVGAGIQESRLRQLVSELGLSDVVFAGAVPNCSIGKFYEHSDIWLNASAVDNMPVSILEAFSSGCVVVSSSAGGIPYLVKDGITGLLSESGNAEALAANILKILRTPGLGPQLSEAAFCDSLQYRWPAVRPMWLGLYRDVIASGAGASGDVPLTSAAAG